MRILFTLLIAVAFAPAVSAGGARLTVRQVSEILMKSPPGHPPDFSHEDLSFLDLSDLDFKQAKLVGANFTERTCPAMICPQQIFRDQILTTQ
jgi:hypothetical protein